MSAKQDRPKHFTRDEFTASADYVARRRQKKNSENSEAEVEILFGHAVAVRNPAVFRSLFTDVRNRTPRGILETTRRFSIPDTTQSTRRAGKEKMWLPPRQTRVYRMYV